MENGSNKLMCSRLRRAIAVAIITTSKLRSPHKNRIKASCDFQSQTSSFEAVLRFTPGTNPKTRTGTVSLSRLFCFLFPVENENFVYLNCQTYVMTPSIGDMKIII